MILLEKLLFYFLIFSIPFQTRKILFQFGNGFNEWTSVYLYLTDILLILILFLWFWRLRKERFLKNTNKEWFGKKVRYFGLWLVLFLIIAFISLIRAQNIQLGFYAWFKLLEFILLFFYLKLNFNSLFSFRHMAQVLVASGLLQSLIALGQYINQKSLGLWYLTESPLGIDMAGVAKFTAGGIKLIRAYGSLPHPNLLAVFLFFCLFCLFYLWFNKKYSLKGYLFLSVIFFFLFFSLFLTFSRLVISTFLLASIIYFVILFKKRKKQIFSLFCLFLVLCSMFLVFAWPEINSRFYISPGEQAVSLRSFYNETAFEIISQRPLLGVGLGNFVWNIKEMFNLLPNWIHQPVHNLYLLIASETGLTGLVIFLFFLFQLLKRSFKKEKTVLLILISSFLFIGFFDHFFWTLQQGQLIFWLTLGLLANKLSTI